MLRAVSHLCLTLCDPRGCNLLGSSSLEFSRQEYWSGLPFPSPGYLPDPRIKPGSLALQADSLLSEPPGNQVYVYIYPLFSKFPSHLCHHRTLIEFPLLYSWFSLLFCFIQNTDSVCMSVPTLDGVSGDCSCHLCHHRIAERVKLDPGFPVLW